MPITTDSGYLRPTFDEWRTKVRANYERAFGTFAEDGVNARLAELDAQTAHAISGMIEAEGKSMLVLYATGQRLLDWLRPLIGAPKTAGAAAGTVRLTGTDGVPVPAGTVLTCAAGVEYVVTTGAVIAGGYADLPVTCAASGKAGNLAAGAALSQVSPILETDRDGVVLAPGLTGGTPAETEEEYRARGLVRLREESTGGNDTDYRSWALEVPGVTRAWVRRGDYGQVIILFAMDSTYANGIPVGDEGPDYSGDIKAVYDHLLTQAPDPAIIRVKRLTARPVAYVVHGLDPDTAEVREAIEAELQDRHIQKAEPGKTWRWSWGAEAVATAAGSESFDAIDPTTSTVPGPYELPTYGGVTYVSAAP